MKILGSILILLTLFCGSMASAATAVATFAGGCFWCMQEAFGKVPGVVKTVVGYTGGRTKNPTYKQVTFGNTGHVEAIQITYNPAKISYKKLLNIFWYNVDPTDPMGQFCDKGRSYIAVIFYHDKQQEQLARQSKQALIRSQRFKQVVVPIRPAKTFYPAEKYHQNYYLKNPVRYKFYTQLCP